MPTYTSLSDVKNVLKLGHEKSFMFSDSLAEVQLLDTSGQRDTANTDMVFTPDEVEIQPSFGRFLDLRLEFTSTTDFSVYEADEKIRQKRLLSTGDINTNWVSPDGKITIKSSAWGGTIESGDLVKLGFRSYISDNLVDSMIEDTEIMVDSMISSQGMKFLEDGKTRLFESPDIPETIKAATKYLTSYYIYTDIFQDKFQDESDYQFTYVKRWKTKAEKYIDSYIKSQGFDAPSVLAFPQFMPDEFGDADVGPGYSGMSTDKSEVVRDAETEDIFEN